MKTVRIRGINLAYDDFGSGPVLVFIHGQPFNRTMWRYQADVFSRTHRLIIPDLRGYGESDVTAGTVLLDEMALDILHLLDALAVKQAVFVGLSMGGQILFEIYRLAPQRVMGMILADTDARAETTESYAHRLHLSRRIMDEGMVRFTEDRIHQFMCRKTFDMQPAVADHLRLMMHGTNPVGSASAQRGRAERRDHTPILGDISIPVLIVVGEEDVFTPPATAAFMQARIPHSEMVIIQDSGHIPSMEQPQRFNEAMYGFLKRTGG